MTDNTFLPDSLWSNKLFTGTWQAGKGDGFGATAPANGKPLGQVASASAEQAAEISSNARTVQREWAALPYDERSAIFRKVVRVAEENFDSIVNWVVEESGSTVPKAAFEASITIKALAESASLPSQAVGEVLPSVPGRLSMARRRPLGVVGIISPFNFPLYLAMRAVAPALALGNAVVLKPDPRTAICGGFVIARLFQLAGLPEGLLNVIPGGADVGASLISDPNVAMIQFTGSTAAGRKIGEAAGKHLKKVSLELGGKNSLIIRDDADLDIALANAAWGAYLHQGQICMSAGRILVHRNIYDEFVERLAGKAKNLPVGDPSAGEVALGPLIDSGQRDNVHSAVMDAKTAGAQILVGGEFKDLFYQPTVLANVSQDNPAFQAEIFGPVAVVTPFDTDEEAIKLANDTDYGLSAAIISKDVGRALQMGEQINTGLLHINDQTVDDEVINPFGGTGASGNGTSIGGAANWEEFTQWQWLTLKGEAPAYPM